MSGRPSPLLSPDWFRVAGLRPRLRPGITVTLQRVRGQTWYVLGDPASGRHHRVNAAAQALLAGCDGRASIDELWSTLVDSGRDDAPTQAEVITILGQAFGAGLLQAQLPPDVQALLERRRQVRRRQRAHLNPLAFRVPLVDPDAWLERLAPAFGWLRHAAFLRLLALLLPLALAGLLWHSVDLAAELQGRLGAGGATDHRLLLLMWLLYPPLKLVHELSHGIVVKLNGGAVHEAGISLLLLNPVPFVDASCSAGFASRRARIAVAGAGIVVEILIAAAAVALWRATEPGLLHDLALAVATVAGVSTLLVNGNPLMRYDGYHVLCELAGLPNLAIRSRLWWQNLLRAGLLPSAQRALLALRLSPAPGERPWLLAYAPLAWAWRSALLLTLAAALAPSYPTLGLALLAMALWLSLGAPLLASARWLAAAPEIQGRRLQGLLLGGGAAALAVLAALLVPLPDRSRAPAVVWLPDDAVLRAEVDGELLAYERADGDAVQPGDRIARLDNPQLRAELAWARGELAQREIERLQHFGSDAKAVGLAEDGIAHARVRLQLLEHRVRATELRARSAGRLVIDPARLPPGRHLARGDVLAHVLPPGAPLVRALVANDDIARVRARPGEISVRLAHGDGRPRPARLETDVPAAVTALPTAALGEAAGGPIALDPRDERGLTPRAPRFQYDLRLPAGTVAAPGERAQVVFRHGEAPLSTLTGRWLRSAFLRHFEH